MANDTPDWAQVVEFPSAQSVNASITNATLTTNASVINEFLSMTQSAYLGSFTFNTPANVTNASWGVDNNGELFTPSLYDGFIAIVESAQGYEWSFVWTLNYNGDKANIFNLPSSINEVYSQYSGGNGNAQTFQGLYMFSNPVLVNNIGFAAKNNTGGTLVNADTITVKLYGIKAQITNPTSNPVQTSGVHGAAVQSGQVVAPCGQYTNVTLSGSQNVVVTKVIISAQNSSGITGSNGTYIEVMANGAYLAFIPCNGTPNTGFITPYEIDLGDGVATTSSGIQVSISPQEPAGVNQDWYIYPTLVKK